MLEISGIDVIFLINVINKPLSGGQRNVRDWLVQTLAPFSEQVHANAQALGQKALDVAQQIVSTAVSQQDLIRQAQSRVRVETEKMMQEYVCSIELSQTQADLLLELLEYLEKECGLLFEESIPYNRLLKKIRAII